MNTDTIKRRCAKKALDFIANDTIIGLGGGSTISYLIEYLQSEPQLRVKIVTPSNTTRMLCIKNGLEVLPTSSISSISVAFDGCDEVDEQLYALKSGGGIHTQEKLVASMAEDYILLVDESKFVPSLTCKHPIVLEIFPESLCYVEKMIWQLDGETSIRKSAEKDGFTISDNGNLLIDVHFNQVDNFAILQQTLINICGVIETSLFTKEVTKVLLATENDFQLISKTTNEVIL
ncbi:ribose 5-phosphate isomerase A [Niallia nealsonii]|uniref:Ribose 5-phosphate isomerase A n=1 Tax=Niallia nealsonii TaxID=115979 RepID=A0A2N0Z5R6_9BACI|nr:ribose 5-phosphate isomerase A [Niallia nealsonii]PKG24850.1 ribose 5-phosphate isomerase A [Niallia nealsonii]